MLDILDILKQRFATLETLAGSVYMIAGALLILATVLGIFQLILDAAPVLGMVLFAIGSYKVFVDRGE